ncbi:helix-turn-helix domain-containing protein [Paraburkholderia sp. MM5384-R2]|uniref:helix-turn-helix domain-containing protein n=1 Tax=Paraburkholderia sp. MM5384-R2 TaxID=2723097 RepID=UPI0016116893|nr:helix-turn-helix transcriptional regulator [Paraburkholderia sp. MM5384-R2]MBB5499300.1 transcriptional regulator with XRE-family HTH domain [Paraburkholderia sp. MM5384-R2]
MNEQKTAKHLGRALAAARADAELTQEQVAEHLGVFVETVSRFERGAHWPTIPRLLELAELYKIPVATLLRRASDRPTDVSLEIAEQLERLSSDDRAWVGTLVKDLCNRLPAVYEHKASSKGRARQ